MAKPTKEIKIGNIHILDGENPQFNKLGLRCVIYDQYGQGWGLPLNDITSGDLRELADLMDEYDIENQVPIIKEQIVDYCKDNDKMLIITEVVGTSTTTHTLKLQYTNHVKTFTDMKLPLCFLRSLNNTHSAYYNEGEISVNAMIA